MKDKREIIRARKAFRRSLKDEKKFLKKGKKEVKKQKKIPLYWMKKHGKKR
ncbi:hypothetical protein AADI38_01720 [Streptococcus pneumoniae]|uniref:hypothetical protein n=1 Tax=Streptococcus pneumoniae TaxID=1313 RepID=UPI0031CC57E1